MFQFLVEGAYRRDMAAREIPLFGLVAVLWGIPYLLIAVALTGVDATFVAVAGCRRSARSRSCSSAPRWC